MRILVYGAGNIGQLYAARLAGAGHDVALLARGARLAELSEHGIRLEDASDGRRTTQFVKTVGSLEPGDAYDLAIVALPGSAVASVLPVLAANRGTPSVLFFGNSVAGPDRPLDALGGHRVLFGFPGAAAVRRGDALRYVILPARQQPTTVGEVDGRRSARVQAIAAAIESAGFPVAISKHIDAWLKTHAAEILPTAAALYACGLDVDRFARTRDGLLLMLRAVREGHRVLAAGGIPVTPGSHRIFSILPEPLLLPLIRRAITDETASIQIGHAGAARDEMKTLDAGLREMARSAGIETPAMDRLRAYLDAGTPPLADGSREIAPSRHALMVIVGALLAIALGLALVTPV